MSAVTLEKSPTTKEHIDRALGDLAASKARLAHMRLAERLTLLEDCLRRTIELAHEWVDEACDAKRIAARSTMRAEEVTAGPMATARHLRLLVQN
ncbi:MAG TPA: hypothetical protein VHV08_00450 [Pirellulales bacterium]|nr:hypothetical protein [Pirellulales bacterium]